MRLFYMAITVVMAVALISCRPDRSGSADTGFLALEITPAEPFNPVALHGEIARYKVTVDTAELPTPVVRYYPKDETQAELDGLPAGNTARVTVEYLNINSLTVRRGISREIMIEGGKFVTAEIVVNNVPIFANVRDGAKIPANLFRPIVFAPEGMEVTVMDETDAVSSQVTDALTDISVFSVSDSPGDELVGINMGAVTPGEHRLTLTSLSSGETSSVTITIVNSLTAPVLPTTAGAYMGTLPGSSARDGVGLLQAQRMLMGRE